MANDPVKAARQRLKERVIDRIIATTRDVPTLDALIDAYAAAVRADERAAQLRQPGARPFRPDARPYEPKPRKLR